MPTSKMVRVQGVVHAETCRVENIRRGCLPEVWVDTKCGDRYPEPKEDEDAGPSFIDCMACLAASPYTSSPTYSADDA